MIRFARLFAAIDQTNSTNAKVDAMTDYFKSAPAADAAWAVFFLTGRRLKRLVPYTAIRDWTLAATGLEEWLLEESYAVVGDGAETAALILDQLPAPKTREGAGVREEPGDGLGPHEGPGFSRAAREATLAEWIENRILPLRNMKPGDQQAHVLSWVHELDRWGRLVLFKLLTGELRLGVSQTLVVRALAQAGNLPVTTVAARLMGDWTPTAEWYERVLAVGVTDEDLSRPYPFFLASPIEIHEGPRELVEHFGDPATWLLEWKWDGIRAQLVKRSRAIHLWSRGEELITDRFPEIVDAAMSLPDGTVLDGEILAFRNDRPLPFSALQQRIGRQREIARKARDVPVVFMAFDILEHSGRDLRSQPLVARRQTLEHVIVAASTDRGGGESRRRAQHVGSSDPSRDSVSGRASRATRERLLPFDDEVMIERPEVADRGTERRAGASTTLRASPLIDVTSWQDLARLRADSREHGVEGVMIKRRDSIYGVGRKRGDWWKWKIAPFTIDAVLIYAQPGSGKRASLLTDYTFGVWHEGELVPIAKAYSGLTNDEIAEMDRWIRRHTIERFGPVRHVEPVHVFELGFEAIAKSTRHRSGIAVRFPRMLRWRKDKQATEADTLETLKTRIR